MKKVIAITLIAVMMLFTFSISAFAQISPTAETKPNDPSGGGSSTSPQTGDVAVYFGLAALLTAAAGTVVAVKKIKQ